MPSNSKQYAWHKILTMNIEDYREYCLSLGADVEEKLPFTAFHHASGVARI